MKFWASRDLDAVTGMIMLTKETDKPVRSENHFRCKGFPIFVNKELISDLNWGNSPKLYELTEVKNEI